MEKWLTKIELYNLSLENALEPLKAELSHHKMRENKIESELRRERNLMKNQFSVRILKLEQEKQEEVKKIKKMIEEISKIKEKEMFDIQGFSSLYAHLKLIANKGVLNEETYDALKRIYENLIATKEKLNWLNELDFTTLTPSQKEKIRTSLGSYASWITIKDILEDLPTSKVLPNTKELEDARYLTEDYCKLIEPFHDYKDIFFYTATTKGYDYDLYVFLCSIYVSFEAISKEEKKRFSLNEYMFYLILREPVNVLLFTEKDLLRLRKILLMKIESWQSDRKEHLEAIQVLEDIDTYLLSRKK